MIQGLEEYQPCAARIGPPRNHPNFQIASPALDAFYFFGQGGMYWVGCSVQMFRFRPIKSANFLPLNPQVTSSKSMIQIELWRQWRPPQNSQKSVSFQGHTYMQTQPTLGTGFTIWGFENSHFGLFFPGVLIHGVRPLTSLLSHRRVVRVWLTTLCVCVCGTDQWAAAAPRINKA